MFINFFEKGEYEIYLADNYVSCNEFIDLISGKLFSLDTGMVINYY